MAFKVISTLFFTFDHPKLLKFLQFVVFCAIVAVARAGVIAQGPIAYAQPIAYQKTIAAPTLVATKTVEDYDSNPQYSYSYDIHDSLTGDAKSQSESRDGDVVKGQYSLIEADGTRRIVDYTADSVNGFNAVVHKEGVPNQQQPQLIAKTLVPAVQKTIISQPAVAYHQPAVAYHAQPAHYAQQAHYAQPAAYVKHY